VDAKTTAPPVHPVVPPATQGAPPPAPDAITKALAEIAQQLATLNAGQAWLFAQQASMQSCLATVESHQASSSAAAMPQVFPYGLPGYGTSALSTFSTTTATPTTTAPHATLPTSTLPAAPPPSTAPTLSNGVPIHLLKFPPSPSPLPNFLLPTPPEFPHYTTTMPSLGAPAPTFGSPLGLGVPQFSKLDFTSYDGMDDP